MNKLRNYQILYPRIFGYEMKGREKMIYRRGAIPMFILGSLFGLALSFCIIMNVWGG